MRRTRFLYFLLCLFMAYFSVFYNRRVTLILFLAVVIFPIISGVILHLSKRKVEIRIDIDTVYITKQEMCTVVLQLMNYSIFPISKLAFDLQYRNCMYPTDEAKKIELSLMGRSRQQVEIHIVPEHTGNIMLHIDSFTMYDLSRCFHTEKKQTIKNDILVLPREIRFEDTLYAGSTNLFENEAVLLPKPSSELTEVLDIREYAEGDRITRIHWKLTDKCDQLMIREYESPLYYYPLFLVDTSCVLQNESMDILEVLYEAFLGLALWHIENKYPFEVAYYSVSKKENVHCIVQEREMLYELLHEIYDNIDYEGSSRCIKEFFASNEMHRYSNILYFTKNLKDALEFLEKTDIYCMYFDPWRVTNEDKLLISDSIPVRRISYVTLEDGEDGLRQAVHKYLIGNRGDDNGE